MKVLGKESLKVKVIPIEIFETLISICKGQVVFDNKQASQLALERLLVVYDLVHNGSYTYPEGKDAFLKEIISSIEVVLAEVAKEKDQKEQSVILAKYLFDDLIQKCVSEKEK